MAPSDSTWLTLRAGLKDLMLQEHHRPYASFNNFTSRDSQSPQMITLIGQHSKTLVMRKLRFDPRAQESIAGEIHLRCDSDTLRQSSPRLFADCELHIPDRIDKIETDRPSGDVLRRPLLWNKRVEFGADPTIIAHMIYAKLLAPFSTLLCFFADDLGGLVGVAGTLAVWLMNFSNRSVDIPAPAYPRVLVLVSDNENILQNETRATKMFMTQLRREAERKIGNISKHANGRARKGELDRILAQQFGSIRVVPLPDPKSPARTWQAIRARIFRDSDELQMRRSESYIAFSARHFRTFFQLASDHFCSDIISPFNFIKASRIPNPVSSEISSHLNTFLMQVGPSQILHFAVPVIASALAFDSYLPGMHPFHPVSVFQQFFYQTCLHINPFKAKDRWGPNGTSPQLANAIEVAFCQYSFKMLKLSAAGGISIHKKVLLRFREIWRTTFSNTTCFSCMSRGPENSLTCHHSLCTTCTIAHGYSRDIEPWKFFIDTCPLCEIKNERIFPQKPDTAGVRALIVEGGGIRGIIPLSFLREVEQAIGLPMDIQEHFDIAVGSSSGALTTLGLCFNRWPVEECLKQFQELSGTAFTERKIFGLPLASFGSLRYLLEIFLSITTDSRYSSAGIIKALKAAYPGNDTFFESTGGGCKVAIVATKTEDASTCLFTNYNGPAKRSPDCGYRIIRPENTDQELTVWQAARASSAAPPYFQSFQGFQDGGLGGHNNPINLALWEQDTIWSRQKKQPDAVLSLGTGFKRISEDDEHAEGLSFFRSRYVPRLFRSFLNSFVGESRWQELQNSLSPDFRDRYHRMNIEFYGEEPSLDDVGAITTLQKQAKTQASSNKAVQKCADNLLASLFYIELDGVPEFDRTVFVCKGRILCRIGPTHRALRALIIRLKDFVARFHLDFEQSITCVDTSIMRSIEKGRPYSRRFTLKVMSLEDTVDIKVDGLTRRARSISNCPYKLRTLITDQGLDCVFGHRNGRKRTAPFREERASKRVKFAI